MLDQNTDRMWYVIGAIVIGAAIIAMGLNIFDESFDSVEDNYSQLLAISTFNVDDINRTWIELEPSQVYKHGSAISGRYDPIGESWVAEIPVGDSWSRGFQMESRLFEIPYGYAMTIDLEMYSPVDSHITLDVNNFPVGGSSYAYWNTEYSSNDNDNVLNRINVTDRPYSYNYNQIKANTWTNYRVRYENTDPGNIDDTVLWDRTSMGVKNDTDNPMEIRMRNIRVSIDKIN